MEADKTIKKERAERATNDSFEKIEKIKRPFLPSIPVRNYSPQESFGQRIPAIIRKNRPVAEEVSI